MIKFALRKWNENHAALEAHIREDESINTCAYVDLVKLVVRYIFNRGEEDLYDENKITVVDDGDGYQGTLLFIIPVDTYQVTRADYLMTAVDYGTCSVCDTLIRIREKRAKGKPTKTQVSDYMTLCRDLVTHTIKPYNCGWEYSDDFDTVQMEGF